MIFDRQTYGLIEDYKHNRMGAIRTTKALISYFREKGAGLFINTTRIGGLITVPFNSIDIRNGHSKAGVRHGIRAKPVWYWLKIVEPVE